MKKLLIPTTLLVTLMITSIVACNKEAKVSTTQKNEELSTVNVGQTQGFSTLSDRFTINSTYGFLVFADTANINSFVKSLVGITHAEIRDYQASAGFTSLGSTYYSSVSGSDTITEEQASLYSLNNDGVVQIQGVIFKQINQNASKASWNYFLTMLPRSLSTQNYTYLAGGNFQSAIMNKFADGEVLNKNLFAFIRDTPTGHQATTTLDNAGRKFIGYNMGEVSIYPCGQCMCSSQTWTYTVFWITVDSGTYTSQAC